MGKVLSHPKGAGNRLLDLGLLENRASWNVVGDISSDERPPEMFLDLGYGSRDPQVPPQGLVMEVSDHGYATRHRHNAYGSLTGTRYGTLPNQVPQTIRFNKELEASRPQVLI